MILRIDMKLQKEIGNFQRNTLAKYKKIGRFQGIRKKIRMSTSSINNQYKKLEFLNLKKWDF